MFQKSAERNAPRKSITSDHLNKTSYIVGRISKSFRILFQIRTYLNFETLERFARFAFKVALTWTGGDVTRVCQLTGHNIQNVITMENQGLLGKNAYMQQVNKFNFLLSGTNARVALAWQPRLPGYHRSPTQCRLGVPKEPEVGVVVLPEKLVGSVLSTSKTLTLFKNKIYDI